MVFLLTSQLVKPVIVDQCGTVTLASLFSKFPIANIPGDRLSTHAMVQINSVKSLLLTAEDTSHLILLFCL